MYFGNKRIGMYVISMYFGNKKELVSNELGNKRVCIFGTSKDSYLDYLWNLIWIIYGKDGLSI
jgi:hypothetical protein